jgi:cyclic pyranopterin phosphate synthase
MAKKKMTKEFSHTDHEGKARMVDVGEKPIQKRVAKAEGFIQLHPETVRLIEENQMKKGDVLTVAEIAGVQAAKRTWELIPLCHNLLLTKVKVVAEVANKGVKVTSEVHCTGQTGVEMEALTAVSVALLTIYDMCKAVDKTMEIRDVKLISKTKE